MRTKSNVDISSEDVKGELLLSDNNLKKRNKISLSGKKKCEMLRNIRREIAEMNHIEYLTAECTHEGDCLGTCPKCDAEIRFLEYELNRKAQRGEEISIKGINNEIVKLIDHIEDSIKNEVDVDSIEDVSSGEIIPPSVYEGYDIEELDEFEEDFDDATKDISRGMDIPPMQNESNNVRTKQKVTELGLTAPVSHWLMSAQILTIAKLCSMTEKDILDKTMVSHKGVQEIKEKLKEFGLSLRE